MKALAGIAAAIALCAWPALASSHAAAEKDSQAARRAAEPSLTEGEVRGIDRKAVKITLKHGPIAHLDMPAMSMVFQIEPAS